MKPANKEAITVVIYSQYSNGFLDYMYGAVTIDRKYPSMYCVREAVELWIKKHLKAWDISFEYGKNVVNFTAGGAGPYTSSLNYKTIDSIEYLGEKHEL